MNAIVPLNVTALRVNKNDAFYIVSKFKGRTALFEKLPYQDDSTPLPTRSTRVFISIGNCPTISAADDRPHPAQNPAPMGR